MAWTDAVRLGSSTCPHTRLPQVCSPPLPSEWLFKLYFTSFHPPTQSPSMLPCCQSTKSLPQIERRCIYSPTLFLSPLALPISLKLVFCIFLFGPFVETLKHNRAIGALDNRLGLQFLRGGRDEGKEGSVLVFACCLELPTDCPHGPRPECTVFVRPRIGKSGNARQ